MKANQPFRNADEAVSPVIGVILMVAITVVLAAVVFVLVTKLSGNQKTNAPSLSTTRDESADRLNVVSADNGLDYGQFKIISDGGSTGGSIVFRINADPAAGACTVALCPPVAAGASITMDTATNPVDIAAGNFVGICSGTNPAGTVVTATALSTVNIKIIHTETNEQVFETTFATIAAC